MYPCIMRILNDDVCDIWFTVEEWPRRVPGIFIFNKLHGKILSRTYFLVNSYLLNNIKVIKISRCY